MPDKNFVIPSHSRTKEQAEVLKRIEQSQECPFCQKNFEKEHRLPILKEGDYWILTHNQWPYQGAAYHFLLVSKKHTQHLGDLDTGAGDELIQFISHIEEFFYVKSGTLGIRFGDPQLNGGTVYHLHAHVIVPYEPEHPKFKEIRFRASAKNNPR